MGAARNILFVTADQWRGGGLSAQGHPLVQTPCLDRLAAEGVLFRRHYAQAAPCGPSRASLHTGMYLQSHRSVTNGTPLDARHTNWALELRALGYDPALFGYTDTSPDPRGRPARDPALRSYEGILPGLTPVVPMGTVPWAWARWLAERGYEIPDNPYELYTRKRDSLEYEDGASTPARLAIPAEHHDTAFMIDQVMAWIREQGARSWCAHVSLLRPHPPWIAPEPYHALYDPESIPGFVRAASAEDEGRQHPWLAFHLGRRYFRAPSNERKLRRLAASYYGLMSEVDFQLGRLFDALRESGAWAHTLVVFTSDHGEQLGDHWMLAKGGYFDQSYHIPLIIRDPRPEADTQRGREVDRFTENVDLMPTLLEWLGASVPIQCDGVSLLPLLCDEGAPSGWRTEVHWEFDFREPVSGAPERALGLTLDQCALCVIRDERYKYVHFAGLPALFFDLVDDPEERVDRAGDPAYASRMLEYAQRMLSWKMSHEERTLTHLYLTGEGVYSRSAPVDRGTAQSA
ncbi:MAG: alkaline phosphatase family protein [Myxococcota bacterium]